MVTTATASCTVCGQQVSTFAALLRATGGRVTCPGCAPAEPDPIPTREQAWRQSTIPSDCQDATLRKVSNERLRNVLTAAVDQFPNRVASKIGPVQAFPIIGPAGVGKSCAVWGTLSALVGEGKVTPREVVTGTEQGMLVPLSQVSDYHQRRRPTLKDALPYGTRVVFLDELGYGAYGSRETRVAIIKDFIDRVLTLDAMLFLVSNMRTGAEVENYVGSAAASRLTRMAAIPPDRDGHATMWQVGLMDQRIGVSRAAAS